MQDDLTRLNKLESHPRSDISFGFRLYRFLSPLSAAIRKKIRKSNKDINFSNADAEKGRGASGLHGLSENNPAGGNEKWCFAHQPSGIKGHISLSAGVNSAQKYEFTQMHITCNKINKETGKQQEIISFKIGYRHFIEGSTEENKIHGFLIRCYGFGPEMHQFLLQTLTNVDFDLPVNLDKQKFEWHGGAERPEASFQVLRSAGRRFVNEFTNQLIRNIAEI